MRARIHSREHFEDNEFYESFINCIFIPFENELKNSILKKKRLIHEKLDTKEGHCPWEKGVLCCLYGLYHFLPGETQVV